MHETCREKRFLLQQQRMEILKLSGHYLPSMLTPLLKIMHAKTALDYARGNPAMEQAFADKLGCRAARALGVV